MPPSDLRLRTAVLLASAFALVPGCAEWDRYWDEDAPTGPTVVRDTTAPSVSVVSPSGADSTHATPVGGAAYAIVVNAEDEGGVRSVRIWVDDAVAFDLTAPPWSGVWDTRPLDEASVHRIRATAVDAAGNEGTSVGAWAQVFNAGPAVVLTTPTDGALVRGTIPVTAEIPGASPEIERVEFLADIWALATVTSAPWTFDLDTNTLPPGVHYVVAKATTTLGSVGVSPPVRVHVNNGLPSVTVDFPDSGHRVATRGTLVLQAHAADDEEGDLPGTAISWSSPLDGVLGTGRELRVTGLTPGLSVIRATATNSWGGQASDTVSVEVLAQPTYSYCADLKWQLFEDYFCTFCHNPESSEYPTSELDLRSYASLMHGGKTTVYECVSPCRPESSLVYNKVSSASPWVGTSMPPPPTFPSVPAPIQERLRVWILEGAPPDDPQDCP